MAASKAEMKRGEKLNSAFY